MFIIVGLLIVVGGSYSVYATRNVVFSEHHKRVFYLVLSILFLVDQISKFAYYGSRELYQNLQFTDACMMSALVFMLGGFFYNARIIKLITPWALLGMLLTLFGSTFGFLSVLNFQDLSSLATHTLLGIASFGTIAMFRNFNRRDAYYSFVFIVLFILYVCLVCGLLGTYVSPVHYEFSTALFKYVYENPGDYRFMADLGMPYPVPTLLFYLVSCSFTLVFFVLKFKFQAKFQNRVLVQAVNQEVKV